jgi:hypothetical protein
MRKRQYWICVEGRKIEKRLGDVYELLLDFPLSFPKAGAIEVAWIPPLSVVNEILAGGGLDSRGKRMTAKWRGGLLSAKGYRQTVETLLSLNLSAVRNRYLYAPQALALDEALNARFPEAKAWRRQFALKYQGVDAGSLFELETMVKLRCRGREIGKIVLTGYLSAGVWAGFLLPNSAFDYDLFPVFAENESVFAGLFLEGLWRKPVHPGFFSADNPWGFFTKMKMIAIHEKWGIFFKTDFRGVPPAHDCHLA